MAALIACAGDRRIVGAFPTAWNSGDVIGFTRLKGERWGRLIGAQMPQDPNRPMLGVQPSGTAEAGVRIEVIPGAPAAKAGLKDGDIINVRFSV